MAAPAVGISALCRGGLGGWGPSETAPPPAQLAENYSTDTPSLQQAGRFPRQQRGPQHDTVHSGAHAWAPPAKRPRLCTQSTPPAPAPQVDCVFTHADARTQRGACVNTNAYVRGHTRRGLPTGHADLYTHTNGTAPPAGSRALPSRPRGSRGRRTARAQLGAGLGRPPSGRPPDCPSGPRCRPALAAA